MNYMTSVEAGKKWGISSRMAAYHCSNGRIDGALKKGGVWLVPENASKPADKRYKETVKDVPKQKSS